MQSCAFAKQLRQVAKLNHQHCVMQLVSQYLMCGQMCRSHLLTSRPKHAFPGGVVDCEVMEEVSVETAGQGLGEAGWGEAGWGVVARVADWAEVEVVRQGMAQEGWGEAGWVVARWGNGQRRRCRALGHHNRRLWAGWWPAWRLSEHKIGGCCISVHVLTTRELTVLTTRELTGQQCCSAASGGAGSKHAGSCDAPGLNSQSRP